MKKIALQFIFAGLVTLSGVSLLVDAGQHESHPAETRVHFFDIGQGDGMLIETPTCESIIIDGGGDNTKMLEKIEEHSTDCDGDIELVISTHPDLDHLGGLLSVLKQIPVEKILLNGMPHTTRQYLDFLNLIDEKNIPTAIAVAGQSYWFGDMELQILHPPVDLTKEAIPLGNPREGGGMNNTSIVALLKYKNKTVLFTADIATLVEQQLLSKLSAVDVLKVGHHGSKYSTSQVFLKKITPRYAVISAGKNNRYGHPHYRVLKNLSESGTKIYRTDLNGDIKAVISDKGLDISSDLE